MASNNPFDGFGSVGTILGYPTDPDSLRAYQHLNTAFTKSNLPPETKLQRAKRLLGDRYVFHKDYKPTPRHSTDPNVWPEHSILFRIHVNAFNAGRLPAITFGDY